eukprot:EG_transcript_52946
MFSRAREVVAAFPCNPLHSTLKWPICFGRATKLAQMLTDSDKTYIVKAKLGERTAQGLLFEEQSCPHISVRALVPPNFDPRGTLPKCLGGVPDIWKHLFDLPPCQHIFGHCHGQDPSQS